MSEVTNIDHFFDLLMDQIESEEEKTVLKLVKQYPYITDTRNIIRDYINEVKESQKDD